jgi:hypothetical protein
VAGSRVEFKVAPCIVEPMGDMWLLTKFQTICETVSELSYCIEYKFMYTEYISSVSKESSVFGRRMCEMHIQNHRTAVRISENT